MFTEKDYVLICHGCGRLHTVRATFLSSPMSVAVDNWTVPAMGCPECCKTGKQGEAYRNGMTPEALERAVFEFRYYLALKGDE